MTVLAKSVDHGGSGSALQVDIMVSGDTLSFQIASKSNITIFGCVGPAVIN